VRPDPSSLTGWLAGVMFGCAILGCRGPTGAPGLAPLAAPAVDPAGAPCADVGTLRVCWAPAGEATLMARQVPAPPPTSAMGWRCAGRGSARLCVDRRAEAPAFHCAGDRCTQSHARRPDDGEWTCVETAGATVCVGGEPAAGVVAGPPDPAWLCGPRRRQGGRDELGTSVCVDLAPDFPDGDAAGWLCRSVNDPAGARVCQRGAQASVLTASCERARPCVDGAVCAGGRCVPLHPAPSCWLDDDCPGGACRFGTCRDQVAR
jgi:hypothetical protein